MPGDISKKMTGVSIYHLLRRALGQGISIAQIVHFNVLDIISVGNINPVVELGGTLSRGRRC
jgi:hypothetical protein